MSRTSRLVSDAILGTTSKNIEINGKFITLSPPTIRRICQAVSILGYLDLEDKSIKDILADFSEVKRRIVSGISILICGDERLAKDLAGESLKNLIQILKDCFSVVSDEEFSFLDNAKEAERVNIKGEIRGNRTMLGQIATFIDLLHLDYKDVVERIPYRNLLIMQKDKMHEVTGDLVEFKDARNNPKFNK